MNFFRSIIDFFKKQKHTKDKIENETEVVVEVKKIPHEEHEKVEKPVKEISEKKISQKDKTSDEQKLFFNRELSWLEFNKRVLDKSFYKTTPLFERINFLSIFSSNLDEFFMVRAASVWDQELLGYDKADPAGLLPKEQLEKIVEKSKSLNLLAYESYHKNIKKLSKKNIYILDIDELNEEQLSYLAEFFKNSIMPIVTPIVTNDIEELPLYTSKSLNIGVIFENNNKIAFGSVQVPNILGRVVHLPSEDSMEVILLEDVMMMYISELFYGVTVLKSGVFRITRNADLNVNEEDAADLLRVIEESLSQRQWGNVVRIEYAKGCPQEILDILLNSMEVLENSLFEIDGPLDLTFLRKIMAFAGFEKERYRKFLPAAVEDFDNGIFQTIKKKNVLIHHPYDSFEYVLEFLNEAVNDPSVLAIKMTLYRVSEDSPIIKYLAKAAKKGKEVTVVVEIKARFDEEHNIIMGRVLENAGCQVIYGLPNLKTHSKILYVVRREKNNIKCYVHLGTGNYNEVTAKLYTDIGLFTSNDKIGEDIGKIFHQLSGVDNAGLLKKLDIAPGLEKIFIKYIDREIENVRNGKEGRIIAKMNSLVDEEVIGALYRASCAGVKIDLIVRGICCLIPNLPGVSENINVKSIIGRFLEHSRIYYFANDGEDEYYLSSADWMPRNLHRRIELLFPIETKENKKKLRKILDGCLKDTVNSSILLSSGEYEKVESEEEFNCQKV